MKTDYIKNLLKEAGVPEDKMKGIVDGIMAENGKDVEAEKSKTAAKEAELTKANENISSLQETVKKFDGKDPAKLEADIAELQKKYDDDIALEKAKAKGIEQTYALKEALKDIGAVDPEYIIYKQGGVEKFAFSADGKVIGLPDIIKPFQEANPALFKSSNDGQDSGTNSSVTAASGGTHGDGGTNYDNMSDAEYYAAVLKKEK